MRITTQSFPENGDYQLIDPSSASNFTDSPLCSCSTVSVDSGLAIIVGKGGAVGTYQNPFVLGCSLKCRTNLYAKCKIVNYKCYILRKCGKY